VTPLRHIVRKELREAWRQAGAPVVLAAVGLLLAASVIPGVARYRATEQWKEEATATVRQQWLTQGTRHPHSAAHYGVIAFRPLVSTALIEPGVSQFVGQMLPLETHNRAFPSYAPAEDATSAARFAALSPALLSLTLVPLVVILIGFRAISGEREDGNLGTLLASGVAPGQLVAGKLIALGTIAVALVILKMIIEFVGVMLAGRGLPTGRLLGLEAVHAAYVLVWVLVTIGVSARVRSSRAALAVLLTLWLVNSFVLPRVAASVGRLVVQEPSMEQFRAAIDHDISYRDDGKPWVNEWSQNLISETLEKYGAQRIEDLPVGYAGIMLKGSDAHYEEVFQKHFTELHQLHQRQEAWQHALAAIGPMIAARSLGQAFAGTDLTHAQHFSDAAERYRRMFVEATNDAIEQGTKGTGWDLRVGQTYWDSIPAFDYQPPAPLWAVRQHGLSIAVLLAWLLAAGVWCVRSHQSLGGV
jgi:ABC-2 type transport system permease protein